MAQITDITMYESGSGGELSLNVQNTDLETTISISNQPYLALFGAPTAGAEDYWLNAFLSSADNQLFASETEKALKENVLSSAGLQAIQQAVEKDTSFLRDFGKLEINVTIPQANRIDIKGSFVPDINSELYQSIAVQELLKEEIIIKIIP
jgi:hypothetical protein